MTKRLIIIALALTLTGCTASGSQAPTVTPAPNSAASIRLPESVRQDIDQADGLAPCDEEDSTDCYWDASTRGNGQGQSFINWKGTTYYAQ